MGLCTRCLDVFLMFLIFTPIIALYKATGNDLVEKAILKHSPLGGAWLLLAIGIGIKVTLLTLRHCLAGTILAGDGVISTMAYYTITYLIGISTVCHIRALSDLFKIYMGGSLYSAIRALTTLAMLLIAMKATKNLVSVPLVLKNDTPQNKQVLKVGTFLGMPGGFVDAFVTVAIVHTVVHTFWAAWHSFLSALPFSSPTYLLIGLTLCFWIVMLNGAIKGTSRALQNKDFDLPRIAFEDLYHIFATMSLITQRRGISWLVKALLKPLHHILPGFMMDTVPLHLFAFALLCFLGISLSLGGMSAGVDGAQGDGKDIVCSIKYFDRAEEEPPQVETEKKEK